MFRTIVCRNCDNNTVTIEKIRQKLYIRCSRCGNILLQAMHLEYWDKNAKSTYKFRIDNKNDRLIEAEIIVSRNNKEVISISNLNETKIRFMYIKEYEYIRQLEEDEYAEICYLNTQIKREIQDLNLKENV